MIHCHENLRHHKKENKYLGRTWKFKKGKDFLK